MSYISKADSSGGGGILTWQHDRKLLRLLDMDDETNDAGGSNYDSICDDDPPGRDPQPGDRDRLGPYAQALAEANSHRRVHKRRGVESRLPPDTVRAIRAAARDGMRHADIGIKFGLARCSVSRIVCRAVYENIKD